MGIKHRYCTSQKFPGSADFYAIALILANLFLVACRTDLRKLSTLETTMTGLPGTPCTHQLSFTRQNLSKTISATAPQPNSWQKKNIHLTQSPLPSGLATMTGNLFPDSEIVYSPSAIDFDVKAYIEKAGGFLSTYRQYLMITGWTSGADIINRVAVENSINPRLLLALLEYQSGCVFGQPNAVAFGEYLMRATDYSRKDLYGQLIWAVQVISKGYYGKREEKLKNYPLEDGTKMQFAPDLNAGTAALQYFFY